MDATGRWSKGSKMSKGKLAACTVLGSCTLLGSLADGAFAQNTPAPSSAPAASATKPMPPPPPPAAVEDPQPPTADAGPPSLPAVPLGGAAQPSPSQVPGTQVVTVARPTERALGSIPAERAQALALTVSGAVSLGSHEAGQLFLITEALRKAKDAVPLRVTTGASAGSANALIFGNEACLTADITPEQSIGYRAWVDVGLDDLFDPKRSTRQSIFHGDALERSYAYLDELWKRGVPEDCDFAYGVAVTRKSSADMKLAEGLVIPRSAERFIVKVDGQRAGPPVFSNYVDAATSHQRPLLPFTATYADDVLALRPVVLASAAFPIAFPPQPIEHCVAGESKGQDPNACSVPTHVDLFVDGGVFDNNPLGIAYRIARSGLTAAGGQVALREQPDGNASEDVDVFYGYIDPDLRTYPIYKPQHSEEEPEEDAVMGLVARLGGQMLENARGHELASLADENFALLEGLWLVSANYPPVSELLGAFFGFFERDFRDFDFHLGTYDSFVDLRDRSAKRLGVEDYVAALDRTLQGDVKAVPARYRKLACIASQVGEKKYRHLAPACAGDELRNFRALLQVTIDRLWSNCRFLSQDQVAETEHVGCKQARGGLPPPVVDPSFKTRGERFQGRQETQFDYTLRLLQDYRFHFKDLGLEPKEADRARIAVRGKLIAMVEALSNAQGSFTDRTAVMTAGRTLVNTIYYEPPRKRAYVGVGSSIYAGYLGRLGGIRAMYWNPDVRMVNLREWLTDGDFRFAAQASLGLEFAMLPLSGRLWQTAFGVRGGYQFAANDAIGLDPCDELEAGSDTRKCSGPVIHVPFNFTLLERVRFSVTPVFYPLPQDFGHNWFELELGIGAELY